MTIKDRLKAAYRRMLSAFTVAPVDRDKLDDSFKDAFWKIIDLVIFDKDIPNDHTASSRIGLFIRGLDRISKIAIPASIGWGFVWVLWFYEVEVGHIPKLASLGDVFSLGVIGITGPLVSVMLCTLILWSGINLGLRPAPKHDESFKFAPRDHLRLYGFFFSGAMLSAILFMGLASTHNTAATEVGVAINLLGPFLSAAVASRLSVEDQAAFKARLSGFLSASASWGLASLLTGLALAQGVAEGLNSPGWAWLIAVSVFALIAVLSVFPTRFGLHGAAAAYFMVLLVAVGFGGSLLRDAPFRIWHIGGVTKRVAFTDREEERKARVRCKLASRHEPHAYSIYILSDLPDEVWYRCDPVHALANGRIKYIPRLLDRTKVVIEDE